MPGSSLKPKVMSAVSPALTAGALLVMDSVGTTVSSAMTGVRPDAPALPAASVYSPSATVRLATPLARSSVGVKVAVRVSPLPPMAPSVPPVVTTSASVKLLPGSSLKLKVMVAVSPFLTVDLLLLMTSLGAKVSILMTGVRPATPLLPAASL